MPKNECGCVCIHLAGVVTLTDFVDFLPNVRNCHLSFL